MQTRRRRGQSGCGGLCWTGRGRRPSIRDPAPGCANRAQGGGALFAPRASGVVGGKAPPALVAGAQQAAEQEARPGSPAQRGRGPTSTGCEAGSLRGHPRRRARTAATLCGSMAPRHVGALAHRRGLPRRAFSAGTWEAGSAKGTATVELAQVAGRVHAALFSCPPEHTCASAGWPLAINAEKHNTNERSSFAPISQGF